MVACRFTAGVPRVGERGRRAGGEPTADGLGPDGDAIRIVGQCHGDVAGDVLVADVLHRHLHAHHVALHDWARRVDGRDGDVGDRRARRRSVVHGHTEPVEHQVDAVRQRPRGTAGEQQADGVGVGVVRDDERARIAAAAEVARGNRELVHEARELLAVEAEWARTLVADIHRDVDRFDRPGRQGRRAAVFLHRQADKIACVVEGPIAVGVAEYRRVRGAVALGGCLEADAVLAIAVAVEILEVDGGDGGIDGVVGARKVDGLEIGERADPVFRIAAAVERPGLKLRVADTGVVDVGVDVVVAESEQARAVRDPRPDGPGGDVRVTGGDADGRGPPESSGRVRLRRPGHEHTRRLDPHRNTVEPIRDPGYPGPQRKDADLGSTVFTERCAGTDHARDLEQFRAVTVLHRHGRRELLLQLGDALLGR